MTWKEWTSKLVTNYISMANSPKPNKLEWCFYLSIIAFVSVILLAITFSSVTIALLVPLSIECALLSLQEWKP